MALSIPTSIHLTTWIHSVSLLGAKKVSVKDTFFLHSGWAQCAIYELILSCNMFFYQI